MAIPIQFRRGTAAQWTLANPTLAVGELGLETDTAKFKIGNGSAAWVSLAYAFEGIGLSNDAYDAATWNEVTTVAPSKNAVRDAIELRQPLNTNLTAYAEDPKAAILVNMPTPLELTEVPRTVYVVTGAGTSVMNGTYALYSEDVVAKTYRKFPFSSEYPNIQEDLGGGDYMMLSASGVERYQAFGGVPLEDAAWFTGGALTGASPVPSIAISGNPEYIGQTAIVTIGGIKTVWTAVSLTEWKESGSDLTSGPVTSSGGVSAIADGAIDVTKISGLGTAATADMANATINAALSTNPTASKTALAIPEHQMAVATSDTTGILGNTPLDDAELVLTVEANATYIVRANIAGTSVGDFSTGGMRIRISGPTSSAIFLRYQKLCYGTAASAVVTQTAATFATALQTEATQHSGVATVTSTYTSQLEGIFTVGATGGTIKIQVAQHANGGAGLTRKAGSTFELIKL